jgi:D-alanyl-D-alanine carboxypeptidase (penicillin-binding protein 5/6)
MLVTGLLKELAPPYVSSKSWAVVDGRTGDVIFGRNENVKREIASLTKIMTAFVTLQIIRQIKLNPEKTLLIASKRAAKVGGTSARLKPGDVLSIWDLLHGLMLPSGNDAATCLAEHFGEYLYEVTTKKRSGAPMPARHASKYFIAEMNRYARALGMESTIFANPHGLSNNN